MELDWIRAVDDAVRNPDRDESSPPVPVLLEANPRWLRRNVIAANCPAVLWLTYPAPNLQQLLRSRVSSHYFESPLELATLIAGKPWIDHPRVVVTIGDGDGDGPSDEDFHRLAAEDVAELRSDLGASLDVRVRLGVKVRDLSASLGEAPLAWVHVGHGYGDQGMTDVDGPALPPKRWADALTACRLKPRTILLAACRSGEVAQALSEVVGVDAVFGFEGDVPASPCRDVARGVLQEIGDVRAAADLPSAFAAACAIVAADGWHRCCPVMYQHGQRVSPTR